MPEYCRKIQFWSYQKRKLFQSQKQWHSEEWLLEAWMKECKPAHLILYNSKNVDLISTIFKVHKYVLPASRNPWSRINLITDRCLLANFSLNIFYNYSKQLLQLQCRLKILQEFAYHFDLRFLYLIMVCWPFEVEFNLFKAARA